MKILIATGIYPPDIGGPATYSKLLNDELPQKGIEVEILSFGEVRRQPKVIRHFLYFLKLLSRSKGCQIIYAQDPVSVGLPSLFASKLSGKKFFIRVAGDYAWEQAVQRHGVADSIDDFQNHKYGYATEFLRSIQRFVVGRADMVITPSIYFKNLVAGWNKIQKNIQNIYNGIELPIIAKSKSEARNELKIADNDLVIVSAGRLVPWKGFIGLVNVVELLVKENPRYKLYIIGDGPDRTNLTDLIAKKGLTGNVSITGSVTREMIFTYLKAADVFVLNTAFESFSFQIIEAMHAGVPVISTNIGNIPEIVENGKNGILLSPDDVDGMVDAIHKLENNADIKNSIVKNAMDRAKDFSIDKTVDSLYKLIK